MKHGTYLFVLPWELGGVGGVNEVVLELYRQFERSGAMQPRLMIPDWSTTTPTDAVDASGVRITRMRLRAPFHRGWLPYELARYAIAMPMQMRSLRGFIRGHDIRVVNHHYVGPQIIEWLIAKALGIFHGKVVLSLHGRDIRTIALERGVRRAIWRQALEAVDVIVACSQGLADETVESFGLSGRNIRTVHNGINVKRLEALRWAAPNSTTRHFEGPHLVNLGTFEHKKGHDLLIKAFARIRERFRGAHLTIMGRAEGTLESTRALVTELRLDSEITLIPDAPHEIALSTLADADVFVLASRNEAFSVALLEAGAFGKPVVATSVCGVPELVDDRRTGILVPPENIDALVAAIIEMLSNREAAAAYGRALRARVLGHFTAEASFEKYLALVT